MGTGGICPECRLSIARQSHRHMPQAILPAEKDGEAADGLAWLVQLEPGDRAVDGDVAQAGQDVVVAGAAMRSGGDRVARGLDRPDPPGGAVEGIGPGLPDVPAGLEQVIEDPKFGGSRVWAPTNRTHWGQAPHSDCCLSPGSLTAGRNGSPGR